MFGGTVSAPISDKGKKYLNIMKKAVLTLFVSILLTPLHSQPLSLEECMAYAVEHSTTVGQRANSLASAREDYISAVASALPSLSAGSGGSVNFGRSVDPETNTYTTVSTFSNSYSVSAGLTLFSGFSTINGIRAAKVARAMGVENLQLARDEAAMNAMAAYFDVVYYTGAATIAADALAASELNLKKAAKNFELGLASAADVAEIEAQVAANDVSLTEQQNNLSLAEIRLREVMNYPQDEPLEIDTDVRIESELVGASFDEVLDNALANNPRMRSAELNSRYSEISYSIAKGRYYPSISAGGGYSTSFYTNLDNASAYDSWWRQIKQNRGSYVSVSMSIPIFSGLGRRTSKHRARYNMSNAMLQEEAVRRSVESEVAQAYSQMLGYGKQYVQGRKKVKATELAYNGVSQKFAKGMVSAIELQTAANNLQQARSEMLRSRLQYIIKCRMVDYYNGIPLLERR